MSSLTKPKTTDGRYVLRERKNFKVTNAVSLKSKPKSVQLTSGVNPNLMREALVASRPASSASSAGHKASNGVAPSAAQYTRYTSAEEILKLKGFAASMQSYLDDMNNVSEVDRAQLRQRWASDYGDPREHRSAGQTVYSSYDAGFNLDGFLEAHQAVKPGTQTASREPTPINPGGVAHVLGRKFTDLVDEAVCNLYDIFEAGLEDKLRIGSAKAAFRAMIQVVHEALQEEQKKQRLRDVYIRAMLERGKGSVARQMDIIHRGVQDRRGDMLAGGSNILMSKLGIAAETVGIALDAPLSELARKVEVLMSVLWENLSTSAVKDPECYGRSDG
ncbi:hypothetical protein FRC01_005055 [Tulasnella sp. 417]|nr:hypothetical protein FRC01_005055 [Tulasnella sp. 417]